MVTLTQLIPALRGLGANDARIAAAIAELTALLAELDEIPVKGRKNVDTLAGCMMAIDAIIGEGNGK